MEKITRESWKLIFDNIFGICTSQNKTYKEMMNDAEDYLLGEGILEIIKVKTEVTICLEELFNKLTDNLSYDIVETEYGIIERSDGYYYDFKMGDDIPCMDGETCEVINETNDYIELQEIDEKIPFKLSRKEFEIAAG